MLESSAILIIISYLALAIIQQLLYNFKTIYLTSTNKIIFTVLLTTVYIILNTVIIKSIADLPLAYSIIISVVSNAVGVSTAMYIKEKNIKTYIWRFEVNVSIDKENIVELFQEKLREQRFSYLKVRGEDQESKGRYKFEIYTDTKNASKRLKTILQSFDKQDLKYVIINSNYEKENSHF